MTKKDFKLICSFHVYGKGLNKTNAIYFDWKSKFSYDHNYAGFKYMVHSNVQRYNKQQLFDIAYLWFTQITYTPECPYRFADTDEKRFKVSLTLGGLYV